MRVLRQNLEIAQRFRPITARQREALLRRVASTARDGRFELYKISAAFDGNDFDGFELRTDSAFQNGLQLLDADESRQLRWNKRGVLIAPELGNVWSECGLTLDQLDELLKLVPRRHP